MSFSLYIYYMMSRNILFVLLFVFNGLTAQDYSSRVERLGRLGMLLNDPSVLLELRLDSAEEFQDLFVELLRDSISDGLSFEELEFLSKVESSDGALRIFTWQLFLDDFRYRHFGVVQRRGGTREVILLNDVSDELPMTEMISLRDADWFGCMYYNLLEHTTPSGQDVYILFGFDMNDAYNRKKIIDVLYFEEDGGVRFGYPLFEHPEGAYNRRVFEYSASAGTRVNYDERLKMIVYSHLIPMGIEKDDVAISKPMPAYIKRGDKVVLAEIKEERGVDEKPPSLRYVPDGSYSGYQLLDGTWVFKEKVWDVTMDKPPRPRPVLDDRKDIFGN